MLLPLVIIQRWARESDVLSALPDAPVVAEEPVRRSVAARLLASLRRDRQFRSELANGEGGQRREAADYVSCPGTQSLDPPGGGCCEAGGGASSSRATIPVGTRSRSLASGSPAATSRSACT